MFRIILTAAALCATATATATAAVAAPSAAEARCESAVCQAIEASRDRLGSVFERPDVFAERLEQALAVEGLVDADADVRIRPVAVVR